MTSMPLPAAPKHTSRPASTQAGQDALKELRTNEVFVAIVGPAGAGSGTAAKILKTFFEENDFEAEIIKASSIIRRVAESRGYLVPNDGERKSLENVQIMQDRGDELGFVDKG